MGRKQAPALVVMETPCVNICVIDQVTRLCAGCRRSIDEISQWRSYSDAERQRIMADLPARKDLVSVPEAVNAGT